jgi:DNA-binding transcriptional LysR family regulator
MDLRQIRFFVALYEEESITKAARRLHVVQPAVSMQIRRLESDYGVSLFDRQPHGVFPNAFSRKLYPQCIEILTKAELLNASLRDASGRLSGRLTIGVPPSLTQGLLASVLLDFHEKLPGIQLVVHEGYTANLLEWLIDEQFDFAVLSRTEGDRRLTYEPLLSEELVLVTSVQTKLEGSQANLKDLAKLKMVVPSEQNLTRTIIETAFEQVDRRLEPAMEVDSLATVFGMLLTPGWASILPISALNPKSPAYGKLQIHRIANPSITRTLVVACPVQKSLSPPARLFIQGLRETMVDAEGHFTPGGHLKIPHPWPGQNSPPCDGGTRDDYAL